MVCLSWNHWSKVIIVCRRTIIIDRQSLWTVYCIINVFSVKRFLFYKCQIVNRLLLHAFFLSFFFIMENSNRLKAWISAHFRMYFKQFFSFTLIIMASMLAYKQTFMQTAMAMSWTNTVYTKNSWKSRLWILLEVNFFPSNMQ